MNYEPAFLDAIHAAPSDPGPAALFADWLEEVGREAEAAYWRWRAENPRVLYGDKPESGDSFDQSCELMDDILPDGLASYLPAPLIHREGGPESPRGDRVLLDLWVDRPSLERDLLAAWLAWWPTRQKSLWEIR